MKNADFPDTIYRVILNAEGDEFKIDVTNIPCIKTAKVSKTIHNRHIKHAQNGVIDSLFGDKIMYTGYCLDESEIETFIQRMVNQARKSATKALERATRLHETTRGDATISRKDWTPA